MFGRGVMDDKAGVAMMLLLAECFLKLGIRLPGNLYLESVIEDEDSGNGTLACTRAGYQAEAAIVIDGNWPFRIIDSHLGQVWLRFEITGVPPGPKAPAAPANAASGTAPPPVMEPLQFPTWVLDLTGDASRPGAGSTGAQPSGKDPGARKTTGPAPK